MESGLKAADGSNEEEWRTCVCLAQAFTRGGSNKLLLGSQAPALALWGQHFPFPRINKTELWLAAYSNKHRKPTHYP